MVNGGEAQSSSLGGPWSHHAFLPSSLENGRLSIVIIANQLLPLFVSYSPSLLLQ